MHCSSCALSIEWGLEDIGVKSKCNYAKSELEVELPENLAEEKVEEAVKKAGYNLRANSSNDI